MACTNEWNKMNYILKYNLQYFADGDGGGIHAAAVDEAAGARFALAVQAQQPHDLVLLAHKMRQQILSAFGRTVEHAVKIGAADHMPTLHLQKQQQIVRRARAHALDLQKRGAVRLQNAGERLKARQQPVRKLVRVAAREDGIQRDLQELHVRQTVHAKLLDLLAHPRPVSLMHAHDALSLQQIIADA